MITYEYRIPKDINSFRRSVGWYELSERQLAAAKNQRHIAGLHHPDTGQKNTYHDHNHQNLKIPGNRLQRIRKQIVLLHSGLLSDCRSVESVLQQHWSGLRARSRSSVP